ncbi:MAG: DEAD/DEAH box helicase, partial [Pseudomonadota bacterium]
MKIERQFTTAGQDAYAALDFVTTASEIRNPDGTIVFRLDDVEVPNTWSQVASDVIAQKYFRKAGVPSSVEKIEEEGVPEFLWRSKPAKGAEMGGETSSKQVFDRLAGAWCYWGWKGGYFSTEEDAQAYYDEMRFMLATQRAAPNSPQWFNTGLHWAYGIDGPAQGHMYVDPFTGKLTKSKSAYEHPQPHACFIQSVSDDLVNDGGIMDLWVREARLFKYGSGTGTNFSHLRGEGERLSGGGKSSGLMGFLKIGDRAAGAIKSGGTTRRAAKMVIVDADHPDIQDFINWKVLEEQKVASIVAGSKMHEQKLNGIFEAIGTWDGAVEDAYDPSKNNALKDAVKAAKKVAIPETYIKRVLDYARQGHTSIEFPTYDTDWDSEAYNSVSGQNSNNSIRVTNAFLTAVEKDADWEPAGAQHAVSKNNPIAHFLAYAISGHHSGLLDAISEHASLEKRLKKEVKGFSQAPKEILERSIPPLPQTLPHPAFFTRMLFSCLVDADFLATEAFMDAKRRVLRPAHEGATLEEMSSLLKAKIEAFGPPDSPVNLARAGVHEDCRKASSQEPGLFSLTVPTGGGKTLASLSFALCHAIEHGQKRVIYVIPFTSIIEQNAAVFEDVFESLIEPDGSPVVLQHHSNLSPEKETERSRLAAENWDAPLVVTTAVQFYESLLADRTSKFRKRHRHA